MLNGHVRELPLCPSPVHPGQMGIAEAARAQDLWEVSEVPTVSTKAGASVFITFLVQMGIGPCLLGTGQAPGLSDTVTQTGLPLTVIVKIIITVTNLGILL